MYPETSLHSVSWTGIISGGDGVGIQEQDTLYHDQGVISGGDGVCIRELNTLCHDQGDLWRWWSVYPGTRHSLSWSGVISGGDGVCI